VLAGLAGLNDQHPHAGRHPFRPRTASRSFRNIEGITDKSPIKVSGVEIGSVKRVELVDDHARIHHGASADSALQNARVRIRSTGSSDRNHRPGFRPGVAGAPEEPQRLKEGDTIARRGRLVDGPS